MERIDHDDRSERTGPHAEEWLEPLHGDVEYSDCPCWVMPECDVDGDRD